MYPLRLTLSQQQVPLISILLVLQPSLSLLHFIVKDLSKPLSDSFLYSKKTQRSVQIFCLLKKIAISISHDYLSVNIQSKFFSCEEFSAYLSTTSIVK